MKQRTKNKMRSMKFGAVLLFAMNVFVWCAPSAQGAVLAAGLAAFKKSDRLALRRVEETGFDKVTTTDTPLRRPKSVQRSKKKSVAASAPSAPQTKGTL